MQQPPNQQMPNVVGMRGGLYPRWWILSATILSLIMIVLLLFGPFFPCSARSSFCQISSWHPLIQVGLVWLAFIIIWLVSLIFGVGGIEVPRRERTRTAQFFRSISEFGPLRPLLIIYGAIALCALIAMWLLDRTTPLAFAVASLVVFVANASLLFRRSGRNRRAALIGYGVLGLIALILTLLYRLQNRADSPFLLAEGLLIIIGIWAIFWHPRPDQQLTAQQQRNAGIARSASPLYILRSLWPINRFFPNRP